MKRAAPDDDAPRVIERHQRLSRSLLWGLQRRYFEQKGVSAWSEGAVPHFVTSNRFIANAYARVVFGWLRDLHVRAGGRGARPVYVVDLGAGAGRFGFHFLTTFAPMLAGARLGDRPVTYVLTDFAESTVAFYRSHPSLAKWVASGQLDFAVYDPSRDREIRLLVSGRTIAPGEDAAPIAAIANYVFDGIPHDVFTVHDGELHEELVTLTAPRGAKAHDDPAILSELELTYESRRAKPDYYDDPGMNDLLRRYESTLDETTLLFPCAALAWVKGLASLSGGELLLLSADKGEDRLGALLGRGPPTIAVHGSFSVRVNYDAIGQYVVSMGGELLRAPHRHASLAVCACVLGGGGDSSVEVRAAFEEAIVRLSPDDFFTVRKAAEGHYDTWTLEELLALVRLSGWDAHVFAGTSRALRAKVESADANARDELYWVIRRVWEGYYPIGEKTDLAFLSGLLLFQMDHFAEAIRFFGESVRLHGPSAGTFFNMGVAHHRLKQDDDALACIERCIALEPGSSPARAMRVTIEESRSRRKTS